MIMIPLPFFIAAAALIVSCREWFGVEPERRNYWFLAFLWLFAFQAALIGSRFGYGVEWLREIQPATAAVLPPLAYLSFRRPPLAATSLVHAIPLAIVLFAVALVPDVMDAVLAANNLLYAAGLAALGLRGSDALGWVEIGRGRQVLGMLWLVCSILVVSGFTDAVISYDFWIASGEHTGRIAGWASLAGIAGAAVMFAVFWFSNRRKTELSAAPDRARQTDSFERLEALMERERLYLDPDINLNRIARRLAVPARDISRAINGQTGQSVSHYVNKLRIGEACRLLAETEMQVTQVVFASGFNTKSNFNREFFRMNRKTPTDWRADKRRP